MDKTTGDLIWGIHPVLELLGKRPESIRRIDIQKPATHEKLQKIATLARQHNIKIRQLPHIRIAGMPKANHQGVVAHVSAAETIDLEEVLALAQGQSAPFIIALDCIQDPHNLGAIIRTASAAGALAIIVPKDRSAPLTGTTAKVAVGALELIKICQVTNLARTLKKMKEAGFWIYGADAGATEILYDTDFSGPCCLVIGGEAKGMRQLIRKECDTLIGIPMNSTLDSLNASVAAGIFLFEIVRRKNYT